MKNWKHYAIMIFIILTFIACDDKEPSEQSKNQSTTITGLFEGSYSATVKGNMKDSEWTGVADKIKNALINAHAVATGPSKSRFGNVFCFNDVQLIVEINPVNYTKWKTSVDGKKMYLAFGKLNNELQTSVNDAVMKMAIPEEALE